MDNNQELLFKLCDGYSTQSKIANQFWIVLTISSIIALTGTENKDNLITLPFTLGSVKSGEFYTISILLVSTLSIVFTSAMIQSIRTRMLIQRIVDDFEEKTLIANIHVQDFVDGLLSPTYNRVAPISQFILGKNQFLGDGGQNKLLRLLGQGFYIILKLGTFLFLYVLPFYALFNSWTSLIDNCSISYLGVPNWILIALTSLACIALTIMIVGDSKYLTRVLNRINKNSQQTLK